MASTHDTDVTSNDSDGVSATDDRRRRPRLQSTTQGWIMPDGPDLVSDPWEVRVHDVSRHGVGFESAEKFAIGQVVRIRIGRGPIELSKRLRIVRCESVGRSGTFSIGGEFV